MKNLFSILAIGLSLSIYAGHHEEGEKDASMHENNFVYISTYTQPAGGNPERLKKFLLKNLDNLEANGYNRCGMLRHQFGGDRSFLTYCYFDSWELNHSANRQSCATHAHTHNQPRGNHVPHTHGHSSWANSIAATQGHTNSRQASVHTKCTQSNRGPSLEHGRINDCGKHEDAQQQETEPALQIRL